MTAAGEWWSERFPRLCALFALAIGVLVLAGWRFDIMVLAGAWAGFTSMKPNTALAVILTAAAMLLRRRRGRAALLSARSSAVAVGIIAALTLYEYRIGRVDGFAQLLFADAAPMGVTTAIGLLLLAGALVLLSRHAPGSSPMGHGIALIAAAIGWLGILGYAYGIESLYTYGTSPASFLSAVSLVMLGAGTAAVHDRSPLVRILGSAGPGGSFARHLIPIALLSPVALGWLWLQGQRWQLYPTEAGVALFAASSAALFIAVVVFYALRLERAHEARAAAERGLVETTQFSRQIVETAQEGILVLDRNFRYVLWNPFMERLTGRLAVEVLGRRIDEVSPEDSAQRLKAAAVALTGESNSYDIERELRGELRWLSSTYTPMRSAGGAVVGVIVIVHDITARKRVETELRESQGRLTGALAATGMGVWEIDLDSRRLVWSESLASLYRRPAESFAGDAVAAMTQTHPDDAARVAADLRAALASRSEFQAEFRVLLPDGQVRWLSSVGHVAHSGTMLLGITTDVTARRTLEAQFRQAQKMEAVGQLAGGVAHDFNNLLTAILGYANVLSETLPGARDRARVDEIIRAAERAGTLTRQLLAFSRRQLLETKVLSLNAVVLGLVDMLRRLIGEHIELTTALPPDLGRVRADRGQLEQVVVNLVVNARDAMPQGGRITIRTEDVVLEQSLTTPGSEVLPGSYVAVSVSDTGTGMSEETKGRLFEPFFTTKERGKGTGLGLATVYGIVRQSRAHIEVVSELGRGTTFTIYFPRTQEAVADESAGATTKPAVAPSGQSVLLVEDEPAVRSLVRLLLQRAGYRVIDAPDSSEAERRFEEVGGVDLLVTDVVMPGGRGTDLYRRLVLRRPGLRVMFMSGYSEDISFDQNTLAPGMVFMEKPFSAETLLSKAKAVLE